MHNPLKGKKFAIMADDHADAVDLQCCTEKLRAAGAQLALVASNPGMINLNDGGSIAADVAVTAANAQDYAGLVIIGGLASVDRFRTQPATIPFVKHFLDADKPVAALREGIAVLLEGASIGRSVNHRRLSAPAGNREDARNAGAMLSDADVCVDRALLTTSECAASAQVADQLVDVLKHRPAPSRRVAAA